MREVVPEVYLIAKPQVDYSEIRFYLQNSGVSRDTQDRWVDWGHDSEDLVEFAGRMCYNSFEPGLNPNVTRIRDNKADYLENILRSQHGSVLEHAKFAFAFKNVSRVMTHEVVRHRAGCAVSQESLRYVRQTDIPFWFPEWFTDEYAELKEEALELLAKMEKFQRDMTTAFYLDDVHVPFSEKKHKTSFMRRFLPEGLATNMTWSANIRALRHVVELRTSPGAEEEIRLVFDQVAALMKSKVPLLFADFTRQEDGSWVPEHHKV